MAGIVGRAASATDAGERRGRSPATAYRFRRGFEASREESASEKRDLPIISIDFRPIVAACDDYRLRSCLLYAPREYAISILEFDKMACWRV